MTSLRSYISPDFLVKVNPFLIRSVAKSLLKYLLLIVLINLICNIHVSNLYQRKFRNGIFFLITFPQFM